MLKSAPKRGEEATRELHSSRSRQSRGRKDACVRGEQGPELGMSEGSTVMRRGFPAPLTAWVRKQTEARGICLRKPVKTGLGSSLQDSLWHPILGHSPAPGPSWSLSHCLTLGKRSHLNHHRASFGTIAGWLSYACFAPLMTGKARMRLSRDLGKQYSASE